MVSKRKMKDSAARQVSPPRKRSRLIIPVSVLALTVITAYLAIRHGSKSEPPLPVATWQETEDGSKRAIVDPTELRAFCRCVGLSDTPGFTEIDPVLTSRIYNLFRRIAARPDDAPLYANLGDLYQRHDFPAAARAAYERAIALDERHEYHYMLANVDLTEGNVDKGIRHLRRSLELDPDYSPTYYHLAEQLLNDGKLNEAEEAYQHLVSSPNGAGGYVGLALVAQARNDPDASEHHLKKALELDPNNYRAHYQLALLYQRRGETELYEKHFGTYQSLPQRIKLEDPLFTSMLLSSVTPSLVSEVVDDLNMQGREPEALSFLSEAINDRPRSPMLLRPLALIQSRLNGPDEALATIESCLRLDNKDVAALNIKCRICLAFHRWQDAMEAAQKAVALDPSRAESHFLRGQAYRAQGLIAEAIESYRVASDIDPDNFLMAVAWAESLLAQQRYDEAEVAYRRADRANAGDARIKDRLEQIEKLREASKSDEISSTAPASP